MRVRVCISSPFFLYVFLFRIWNEFTSSSSSIFQIASVSIAKHNAQWKWLFIVSHGHSRCLFSENANVNNEVYNNNKRTQKQQTMWKTETKIIECDCIAPSLSLFSLEINFDGCWNAIVSVRVNECTFKFHCNSIGSKNAIEKKNWVGRLRIASFWKIHSNNSILWNSFALQDAVCSHVYNRIENNTRSSKKTPLEI